MALTNREKLTSRRQLHNRLYDIHSMLNDILDAVNTFPYDKRKIAEGSLECAIHRVEALDNMLELDKLERSVNRSNN